MLQGAAHTFYAKKKGIFFFLYFLMQPEERTNERLPRGTIGTVLPQANEQSASSIQRPRLNKKQHIGVHGAMAAPQGMYMAT